MIKNNAMYKCLDIHPVNLKIQKVDPESKTIYYKYNDGTEEWYDLYDTDEEGNMLIKHFKNSSGFEFWIERLQLGQYKYTDNIGNVRIECDHLFKSYSDGISHIEYVIDNNGHVTHFRGPDNIVYDYDYDDYGNIITTIVDDLVGDTTTTRFYYEGNNLTVCKTVEGINSVFMTEQVYTNCDGILRRLSYKDSEGVTTYTQYIGDMAVTTVYKYGEKIMENTTSKDEYNDCVEINYIPEDVMDFIHNAYPSIIK